MEIALAFISGFIASLVFCIYDYKKAVKELEEVYGRIQEEIEERHRQKCRYCPSRLRIDILKFPVNSWQECLIAELPEWEDKEAARLYFAKIDAMDEFPIYKKSFVPFYDRIYNILSGQCLRIRKLMFDTESAK